MIKKLRRQFICVIMAILLLMISGILQTVIYFTGESIKTESLQVMRQVANRPFHQDDSRNPPPEEAKLPYLAVRMDQQGEMTVHNNGFFSLPDEAYIQDIVDSALASDSEHGVLIEQQLCYFKATKPKGVAIVFLDISRERAAMRTLYITCFLIFLASGPVFLLISILLSRWAVRPAEKAWERQRQFVADASHELKTPLAVIMANAELLQNEDAGETERKDLSRNILSMTYQMRSLVENMLEMARMDNGLQKIKRIPMDFSQLVNDAVLSFQLLYAEQELGLECSIPEGIRIRGSEQHLYQVLDVLLDNALKYSTVPGTVHVKLHKCGCICTLSVASPGEPLSRDELRNIFKRFYRADKARAINGSYGLGLSIAQSVVDAHKGKIWAESHDGLNTFFVQLPL